ncbi:alcohol dehydrogenase [Xylariales sp. AK1849]|nr:alcohol dehydrogenase [Xylariales sp. AK1849]
MAAHTAHNLPPTYEGLVLHSPSEPLTLKTLPTPLPTPGTVIVKPLYSVIAHYAKDVFANGNPRGYMYAVPLVPGGSSIARVAAVPPDATVLQPGQLVFVEVTVRARDDAGTKVLQGVLEGWTEGSRRLFAGEWRDGSWAQYMKAPLESVHVLDEELLVGRLGYRLEELGFLCQLVVPFGGLSDVGLKPGETVLIAPATGSFGGAAVHAALALGARVIAMGRNEAALERLKQLAEPGRVEIVRISGDVQTDTQALATFGAVDVFFDMSPPTAGTNSHIEAGFASLKPGGRVSLMGGVNGNIEIPYVPFMYKGITLKGTYMNTTQQVKELIKLIERGILKIGRRASIKVTGKFSLEHWREAMELASAEGGAGHIAYLVPHGESKGE